MKQAPTDMVNRGDSETAWLTLGFFMFGFAVSWTTALTQQEGSGVALLTGFFSFVGGAFVSFAGFRLGQKANHRESESESKVEAKDPVRLHPKRFGLALFGLSAGLVLGGPSAYILRTRHLVAAEGRSGGPALAPDKHSQEEDAANGNGNAVDNEQASANSNTNDGSPEAPYVYNLDASRDQLITSLTTHLLQRKLLVAEAVDALNASSESGTQPEMRHFLVLVEADPNLLLDTKHLPAWLENPEVRRVLGEAIARRKSLLSSLSEKEGPK